MMLTLQDALFESIMNSYDLSHKLLITSLTCEERRFLETTKYRLRLALCDLIILRERRKREQVTYHDDQSIFVQPK